MMHQLDALRLLRRSADHRSRLLLLHEHVVGWLLRENGPGRDAGWPAKHLAAARAARRKVLRGARLARPVGRADLEVPWGREDLAAVLRRAVDGKGW